MVRDNPCTTGTTEAYKQGGQLKLKTEPDPDGSGSQTARKVETIYNDTGQVVATRYNTESWRCATYDTRGRSVSVSVPAYGSAAARTIQNDYSVGGDPLETTTWDGNGWIVIWTDLLGRTTKYRDVYDDETTTTYDSLGRITQKVSPMGTETFTYDSLNRLTDRKLDGTTYATAHYDQYSRPDYVDYANAGQLRTTFSWDVFGRNNTITYRLGNGTTTVSDTLARSQSGRVTNDITASGGSELWNNYGFDAAGRLTSTGIGGNSFAYSFGAQNSTTCGTGGGTNPNSGKSGNRTSQTINGSTSYFCYDYADRLTTSSNALYNSPTYDSHGNMTQIGTGTTPLHLFYDSSDRSTGYEQYNSSTTGVGLYYDRDVQGRIIGRYKNTITNGTWAGAGGWYYHYTGAGSSPDYVRDSSWTIVEKTLQLPGGILLTIKPTQTGNAQKQYSLPGLLGRTLLTTDAAGTNTSNGNGPASTFTYDPFGNPLAGSVLPANTTEGSYGYGGSLQKLTETNFALAPVSMGARIYLSGLGRFTTIDPVPGGTANAYAYALDPVNFNDYSGLCILQCTASVSYLQPAAPVQLVQKAALGSSIQKTSSAVLQASSIQKSTPRAVRAPVLKGMNMNLIPVSRTATRGGAESGIMDPPRSRLYDGLSSAHDFVQGGALIGGGLGCIAGGIAGGLVGFATAGIGAIPGASYGCIGGGELGSNIGGMLGAPIGFFLGGTNNSHADDFAWGPDQLVPPW